MTVIDFLDYNVIDTLILVKTLRPSRLIVMADKEDLNGKAARSLLKAVKDINPGMRCEAVEIKASELTSAVRSIEDIARKSSDEVYLNIDIEHGISTAASYSATDNSKITPVCVDMTSGLVRNLRTLETIKPISHISLGDFQSAIGAKRIEGSHEMPPASEYSQIVNVAETLFENVHVWNVLCGYIGKNYSHESKIVRIPEDLGGEARQRDVATVRRQIKAFCDNGFLRKLGKQEDLYEFTSERHRGYMVVYGIWLEMYIYIKFKPYFEEIHCGYVIDWDSMDGYDTKDNEIDVIGIKNSRPILISCKMRMPTKEDIYEIGYISEMIGGAYAIPAIATTATLDRRQSYKPGLYPRFKKMKVGLIETSRIEDFISEVFHA